MFVCRFGKGVIGVKLSGRSLRFNLQNAGCSSAHVMAKCKAAFGLLLSEDVFSQVSVIAQTLDPRRSGRCCCRVKQYSCWCVQQIVDIKSKWAHTCLSNRFVKHWRGQLLQCQMISSGCVICGFACCVLRIVKRCLLVRIWWLLNASLFEIGRIALPFCTGKSALVTSFEFWCDESSDTLTKQWRKPRRKACFDLCLSKLINYETVKAFNSTVCIKMV